MRTRALVIAACLILGILPRAFAQVPADLPVLSNEVPRGTAVVTAAPPAAPTPKTIDGDPSDWVGDNPGFAGFAVRSAGELVYQDYIFDAYGADDGTDYERPLHDDAQAVLSEEYRVEALQRKDVPGEFGAPNPEPLQADPQHGDAPAGHQADLRELRIAADAAHLQILARTTNMLGPDTALLLLIDSSEGSDRKDVPFAAGIVTDDAEYAVLLRANLGTIVDLATGERSEMAAGAVETEAAGWTNTIEAAVPLDAIGAPSSIGVAAAVGPIDEAGLAPGLFASSPLRTPITNVAFRPTEPVRWWFDRLQAYALYEQNIDRFAIGVKLDELRAGATDAFRPGPGYHERVFRSSEAVSNESGLDGIYQHYGVYLPGSYDGAKATPLQWWLHWRGGTAHEGAAVAPRLFKHFGEDRDTIVISPRGRGTGTWYVGEGHVDVLEVFSDVRSTLNIDPDRVYVAGHSMGGWGSYLLSVLHPDWFAAAAPFAGPPTQGLYTGVDFEGCDDLKLDEYTPCYGSANGGRPRDQHTRRLLENVLHVPFAIFHGTFDELVPVSGVTRQAERFVQLGYRHRYYLSPGYEHYSHPAMDQWTEAAAYEHRFVRDPNPARVIYFRDMPFERATEEVQANLPEGAPPLEFSFDRAYWMSELTPIDPENGVARFDGTSHALPSTPYLAVPDSAPPANPSQAGPYVVTGMQWLDDPTATTPGLANGFAFNLTDAGAVRLDLDRMGLDSAATIEGQITSNAAFSLRLAGTWVAEPDVAIDGVTVEAALVDGVLQVEVPAGTSQLTIG